MTFHEVRLPINDSWGTSGGPLFLNTVNERWDGDVDRFARALRDYREWDVEYKPVDDFSATGQFLQMLAAFLNKRAERVGFRFQDPSDNSGANEFIGVGDGSTRVFQLKKNYTEDTSLTYSIKAVNTGSDTVTCEDVDTELVRSGKNIKIQNSTDNDGWYELTNVATESYAVVSGGTQSPPMLPISGDVSAEFAINQLIEITDMTDSSDDGERNILEVSFNAGTGNTEITFQGGAFNSAPDSNGNINGNTTLTLDPAISDSTADGEVFAFFVKDIVKPVQSTGIGTIEVGGVSKSESSNEFFCDYKTGVIVFNSSNIPPDDDRIIVPSFEYDFPVFINTDKLDPTWRDYSFRPFTLPLRETTEIL